MTDEQNMNVKTLAKIHLCGAATLGFTSLIVWLVNRGKHKPIAAQAFISLLWNTAYHLIVIALCLLYLTVIVVQLIRELLTTHEFVVLMIIEVLFFLFMFAINMGITCFALRKVREGVPFPYLLPPIRVAKWICQKCGVVVLVPAENIIGGGKPENPDDEETKSGGEAGSQPVDRLEK